MKINKYKYKYIKSLIKQFRKKLPTSNFKKQDIKNAVYGELRKLDYIQKISKNYEKRNIIDQIVYEEKIDKAFDKQRHLLKYHQLKQENKRLRDIIQQSISESVRNFIADKLAERRIESEDNMKEYISKGVTICIAKKCDELLYNNQSTSNPKYCMRCG
tara:strand:- start:40 stop:516 length:477 start_codon:yes stop_codon:yes gene_type:complete